MTLRTIGLVASKIPASRAPASSRSFADDATDQCDASAPQCAFRAVPTTTHSSRVSA